MNQLPRQENNSTGRRIKSWQVQKKNRKRKTIRKRLLSKLCIDGACAGHRREFNGGLGHKWYQSEQQCNTIKLDIYYGCRELKVKIL